MAYRPRRSLEALGKDVGGYRRPHKEGEVKEFGYFLDGASEYTIGEGKTTEAFRNVSMFSPFFEFEVHKIIPYPQCREISRELLKARKKRQRSSLYTNVNSYFTAETSF